MSKRPILIVTVHGTFGGKKSSRSLKWNEKGSQFTNSLLSKVRGYSSVVLKPFYWDGKNTIESRLFAAKKLRNLLCKELKNGRKIYVVCHSHGGTVSIEALNNMGEKANNIDIISISTPNYVAQKSASKLQKSVSFWGFVGGTYWIYWTFGHYPANYLFSHANTEFMDHHKVILMSVFVGIATLASMLVTAKGIVSMKKLDLSVLEQSSTTIRDEVNLLLIGCDNDEVDLAMRLVRYGNFVAKMVCEPLVRIMYFFVLLHILQNYGGFLGGSHCYKELNYFLPHVTKCTSFFEPAILWVLFAISLIMLFSNLCKAVMGWEFASWSSSVSLVPRRTGYNERNLKVHRIRNLTSMRRFLPRHSLYKNKGVVDIIADCINRGGVRNIENVG